MDEIQETQDVGIPGLFSPNEWDIHEEMQNNEALLDFRRERLNEEDF